MSEFLTDARRWLDKHLPLRKELTRALEPGDPLNTAVFHALTFDEERTLLDRLRSWQRLKASAGYHAVAWPAEVGGLGRPPTDASAFARLESQYETPVSHELFSVTTRLIAPIVDRYGSTAQRDELVAALLRTDVLCCQLFSEPSAGSDLAGLATRATRDGGEWVVNGQKVWSSGAQFAAWGLLIARHDPDAPKHRGLTAFLVPMDTPGVEVRPIRQMSGGSSFNEVFLTDVRLPDSRRLGDIGAGWEIAMATLGHERDHAEPNGGGPAVGAWAQVLATARAAGRTDDPVARQALAGLYTFLRVERMLNVRAAALRRADAAPGPGPEGSLGKLFWTENMRRTTEVVSLLLGAALVADTGHWATYEWAEHVLGAPGYRIAGGSDEVQRNIIGERVLGLPSEPRVDKDLPWRMIPR